MGSAAERLRVPLSPVDQLREARGIILHEAEALAALAKRLDGAFCTAAQMVFDCPGTVVVSGMGKAGLIGQKIAATLSSTGTRAHFLHPADAVHGDLGCLHAADLLLALSNSGETEELCRLLPIVRRMG
ncbi:MAG: SIS domain-containing protein, partial [Planctomycetaceae bacterium]